MPTTNPQSPRRKRTRRYTSTSNLSAPKWGPRSGSPTSQRRRASSPTTSPFAFFPSTESDTEDIDHDSGLEEDASFATIQPTSARAPLAYSSLPPTPISSSPFPRRSPTPPLLPDAKPQNKEADSTGAPQFSLWDYLREELLATDFDSHQEQKWERVSNFLSMPLAIEKVRHSFVCTVLLLSFSQDYSFRFHPLPRLVSVHIHYPSYTLHARIRKISSQHHYSTLSASPTISEG